MTDKLSFRGKETVTQYHPGSPGTTSKILIPIFRSWAEIFVGVPIQPRPGAAAARGRRAVQRCFPIQDPHVFVSVLSHLVEEQET